MEFNLAIASLANKPGSSRSLYSFKNAMAASWKAECRHPIFSEIVELEMPGIARADSVCKRLGPFLDKNLEPPGIEHVGHRGSSILDRGPDKSCFKRLFMFKTRWRVAAIDEVDDRAERLEWSSPPARPVGSFHESSLADGQQADIIDAVLGCHAVDAPNQQPTRMLW